jgi:predicted TPR repeat methyltransferase
LILDKDKTNAVIDIFDKYAHMYESKYMSVEKYHTSLEKFCSSLSKENASILELACGPGNITKYLLDKIPTLKILGTDLSPAMIKLAQGNNPSANILILDCRSILDLKSKYDAIVCGFGLPYISKEEAIQMIKDASISLNQEGLIYLSTMEDDYTKSGFTTSSTNPNEGLFMYFHQEDYLVDAMTQVGFEIIDISRVKYVDKNQEVVDLIIIGKLKSNDKL